MFHMHGKLKGEIKNLTLRQADDTTSFRPFSANAEAFDESKLKKIPKKCRQNCAIRCFCLLKNGFALIIIREKIIKRELR